MCYDVVFKSVFLGNENILAKMISDITGFDYSILENKHSINKTPAYDTGNNNGLGFNSGVDNVEKIDPKC